MAVSAFSWPSPSTVARRVQVRKAKGPGSIDQGVAANSEIAYVPPKGGSMRIVLIISILVMLLACATREQGDRACPVLGGLYDSGVMTENDATDLDIATCTRAIERHPDNPKLLSARGHILRVAGKLDRACQDY